MSLPTVSKAQIDPSGRTLTIILSEPVLIYDSEGFLVKGVNLTYYGVTSSNQILRYRMSRRVSSGESLTLSYTKKGAGMVNGINNPLQSIDQLVIENQVV